MTSMKPEVRDMLFIGGSWVPSSGTGSIEVVDSTTEEVIGTVPEGTTDDIDRAVRLRPEHLTVVQRFTAPGQPAATIYASDSPLSSAPLN